MPNHEICSCSNNQGNRVEGRASRSQLGSPPFPHPSTGAGILIHLTAHGKSYLTMARKNLPISRGSSDTRTLFRSIYLLQLL